VSTRTAAALALAGIAQRPHDRVVDLGSACRYDKAPVSLFESATGEWLDAQTGAVGRHLNLTRLEPKVVT
jgi:hypothetical protein